MPETTKAADGDKAKPFSLHEAGLFLPRFVIGENGCGVTVKLPDSYRKWIKTMSGDEKYRHKTEEEIAALLTGTLKDDFEINIRWSPSGPKFEVPGNSCGVFVDGSDYGMREYVSHNVDAARQALVLHTCLSIHLRNTLIYLSIIEKKQNDYLDSKGDGFFETDIIFDERGNPSIIRDHTRVEFPEKRT